MFENEGHCSCCDGPTVFRAEGPWWRDQYLCTKCGSIPRDRALMYCIERFFPRWREAALHETSPVPRGASRRLRLEAPGYVASQRFPDTPLGTLREGVRCEDLEALTFGDESFDLHVSQDVMEHVFEPERAFREIARTLKAGGAHVFTTPLVNRSDPTERVARRAADGRVEHLGPPEYHGNPISEEGSLVTTRWGYDITRLIWTWTGDFTEMLFLDSLDLGIRAELIEVLITRKPKV